MMDEKTVGLLREVSHARAREQVARLDVQRAMRALAPLIDEGVLTQTKVAFKVGISQAAVSTGLQRAASVSMPLPGFSGASPYEICQRFAAGQLTREQVVDELTRWDYPPVRWTDGVWDDLMLSSPGSWDEVVRARSELLIDGSLYTEVLELVSANEPPRQGPTREDLAATAQEDAKRILAIVNAKFPKTP